jgi:hypothetical protein
MSDESQPLITYEVYEHADMPISPAEAHRDWMDQTGDRFAYRCLPLVLANQSGWFIECPVAVDVLWRGGKSRHDLLIHFESGIPDPRVMSHFGSGVVTFSLPYLFRTPPGINLWVKGPTNRIKDGVQALEGVVETDWSAATFTMNWKLTRPNEVVRFEKGEPICMIVPVPRGLAENLAPRQVPLSSNMDLYREYIAWQNKRNGFLSALLEKKEDALAQGWEKDYFKGTAPDGRRVDGHQTKLNLKRFTRS